MVHAELFHPSVHHLVRNELKIKPLMANGDVHIDYVSLLQDKAGLESDDWDIDDLEELFWDIELQMICENALRRSASTFVALLNAHKKLLLWTKPSRYRRSGKRDIAVHRDFRDVLHRQIWTGIMRGQGLAEFVQNDPEEDPREWDRAFVAKMDVILAKNEIEKTRRRIFLVWNSPRDLVNWLEPEGLHQMDYDGERLTEPAPVDKRWERVLDQPRPDVWKRPRDISNVANVNYE